MEDKQLAAVRRAAVLMMLSVTGACEQVDSSSLSTVVKDSAGVITTITDASLLKRDTFAVLEEPLLAIGEADSPDPGQVLYNVLGAVVLGDTSLVLLNAGTQEVRFYDTNGRLWATAGGRGDGPGELAQPTMLMPGGAEQIMIWDAGRGRRLTYSHRGAFLNAAGVDLGAAAERFPGSVAIRPEARWELVSSDRVLVFSYLPPDIPAEPVLFRPYFEAAVAPLDMRSSATLAQYAGIEQVRLPTGAGSAVVAALDGHNTYHAVAAPGRVYIGDSAEFEMDRYGPEGRLEMRITVSGLAQPRSSARDERDRETTEASLLRRGLESPEQYMNSMPVGGKAPAFDAVVAGHDGGVWIRWRQEEFGELDAYAVFDSEGMFQGSAFLPLHERILSVSENRVVVKVLTDLGVERVLVYGLDR